MLFLHHPEVALSRELLAGLPAGVEVLDWSDPAAAETYQGPPPSALPSVVVDVPAYTVIAPMLDEEGCFLGMGPRAVPAHQEALRLPTSWEVVQQYLDFVTARAVDLTPT